MPEGLVDAEIDQLYSLKEVLGKGAQAIVYRAIRHSDSKTVACWWHPLRSLGTRIAPSAGCSRGGEGMAVPMQSAICDVILRIV